MHLSTDYSLCLSKVLMEKGGSIYGFALSQATNQRSQPFIPPPSAAPLVAAT